MRAGNELRRLSTAEPALLADTEPLVDAGEEERILGRILASSRTHSTGRGRMTRRRRTAYLVVGVGLAAALVAVASIGHGKPSTSPPLVHHHPPLSGATFQLAGYHFKTPAGFKASSSSCPGASSGSGPRTVLNGFAAAASADGGCVEATLLVPGSPSAPDATPADAQPVAVGSYQGYFVAQGSSGDTLYVELPSAAAPHPYLVLFAQGLTEEQLIAVAVSGLPGSPAG